MKFQQDSDQQNASVQEHMETLSLLKEEIRQANKRSADRLIKKGLVKQPPKDYNIGDKVLYKLPRKDKGVKRGGKTIGAPVSEPVTIIGKNDEFFQYKIRGSFGTRLVMVSDITDVTIEGQRNRPHSKGKYYFPYAISLCIK